MRRWTLDEIREALLALARDSGVDEIALTVNTERAGDLGAGRGDDYGWATPRHGTWVSDGGDQDPIDRVLARGEYQP